MSGASRGRWARGRWAGLEAYKGRPIDVCQFCGLLRIRLFNVSRILLRCGKARA